MRAAARRFPSGTSPAAAEIVGIGEKFDALGPSTRTRAANRILGMGDVLSLIEKASRKSTEEGRRDAAQAHRDEFTLEDFRDQMPPVQEDGLARVAPGLMPRVGVLRELKDVKVDEKEIAAWWRSSIR